MGRGWGYVKIWVLVEVEAVDGVEARARVWDRTGVGVEVGVKERGCARIRDNFSGGARV